MPADRADPPRAGAEMDPSDGNTGGSYGTLEQRKPLATRLQEVGQPPETRGLNGAKKKIKGEDEVLIRRLR